jgi:hypothetical protein
MGRSCDYATVEQQLHSIIAISVRLEGLLFYPHVVLAIIRLTAEGYSNKIATFQGMLRLCPDLHISFIRREL